MRYTVKGKILTVAIAPVLLLGLVSLFISITAVRNSLLDEVQDSLRGTASATLAAYSQNSGEYIVSTNGDVWKGAYNISKSENLVDSIKEQSGMDVTFFYGDERIMTSALDKNGNRILGSPAGDTVVEKVLKGGEEYFSSTVSLDGELNYGYYMPVYQSAGDSSPVGMVFVGTNRAEKDASINGIVALIAVAVVVVMVLCAVVAVFIAFSITGSLKKSIGIVQTVATGELSVEIDQKLLGRKDEIGDLSRAVGQLQEELKKIIRQIADNTDQLMDTSDNLENMAKETNATMHQVEGAVNTISASSMEQAKSTMTASEYVATMGDCIERTTKEVDALNENAGTMRESGRKAAETIGQLKAINEEVEQSIETVAKQTMQTNTSAQKIREATALITDIAEETNLLSLNASIEAARAGESGRGFEVVAGQIRKLAEQSNESSHTIEEIINALLSDSDIAVGAMQRVQEIIGNQSRNMVETAQIVDEVMKGIETSVESIEQIGQSASDLEQSRAVITRTVDELSSIAQQNASGTQETCSQTETVAGTFGRIEESATDLKHIAERMEQAMQHFHI